MRRFFLCLMMIASLAVPAMAKTEADAKAVKMPAEPLAALTQQTGWLNTSRPLAASDLQGRMVLVDFWTYCCINCMQVLPELARLERQYGSSLTVIGVHSAKFKNEADTENIRQAIMRYGIRHPVVNDFDFATWDAFSIKAWPSFVLISPQGRIEGRYAGEDGLPELAADMERVYARYKAQLRRDALPLAPEADKAAHSLLSYPGKVAYLRDYRGKPALAVADSGHNRIVITALDGKVLQAIGTGEKGRNDGDFDKAAFNMPQGLLPAEGALYIADTGNHLLRKADLRSGKVTTLAGTGSKGGNYRVQDAPALETALASPWDIAFWPDKEHIAIAMAGLHQLWSYDVKGGTVSRIAGTGEEGLLDGPYLKAHLAQPSGLSAHDGKLYFVDAETSSLRVLERGQVRTLIGKGLFEFGYQPGMKTDALMQHPLGVLADRRGVFIADAYNHAIRRYDPDSGRLENYAGTGQRGKENGKRGAAQFNEPGGLALGDRVLYVADTNNLDIRRIDLTGGEVSTLYVQEAPEAAEVALAQQLPNTMELLPGEKLALAPRTPIRIILGFRPGWHINRDAPSYLALFDLVKHNAAAVFDRAMLQQNRMLIPERVGTMYRLQGTFYYCEEAEGAQCLVKSVDIPVSFEEGGKTEYRIELN